MKIKRFYLNVDDDKISFYNIILEEGDLIPEKSYYKDFALSRNPDILDISHLSYMPAKLSVWDGTDFIAPNGKEHGPACSESCENGCKTFAFLVDNRYFGANGYCLGNQSTEQIIAALMSNPRITYDFEEV